jgi:polar amino acid transport system substrate-binding protein
MKKIIQTSISALLLALSSLSFFVYADADSSTIKVVTDATFPPLEFKKNGKLTGFDIELFNEIAKRLNKKVEWTHVDFKGLIPSIVSGRADVAVSGIYITEKRAKVVDFTDSYLSGGLVVITKSGNPNINSLSDLDGKKVSVQIGTKSVSYLKENYPKIHLVEVEKNQQMFTSVTIGRTNAAVTGKPAAYAYSTKMGGVKILSEQLTTEKYGIAVKKGLGSLKEQINQTVKAMKQDGSYDAIYAKWLPST